MALEFLSNPLILLAIVTPIILLAGILIGNLLSQPRKNRVIKLSPESGRGIELEVKNEDATNVYCDPVGNIPPQRFIKRLKAFSIIRKGWFKLQNYALWLGRYGTAYVTGLGLEDVKVTIKEAIQNLFGEGFEQIPQSIKDKIEESKLGVMVELAKEGLTPVGMSSVSEDDINRDNDERAMENLWEEYQSSKKGAVFEKIAWIGCGVAIGIICALIFKWGAPIIIQGGGTQI